MNFQPDNQNPTPENELRKILYMLGSYYEAVGHGTRDDIGSELQKVIESRDSRTGSGESQPAYFLKMLNNLQDEIRSGAPGAVKGTSLYTTR